MWTVKMKDAETGRVSAISTSPQASLNCLFQRLRTIFIAEFSRSPREK
jgi:hypothetical protein